ncbi:MAG TPA: hypothetical protein DCQ37_00380 [Desulfobacteraceae bacterium]|nr:hypothetical protein [Desulfobacteraceae bacterium]
MTDAEMFQMNLLTGRPCRMRLSTRIILTEYTSDLGESYLLGFMTEGVTEIIRKERKAFLSSYIGTFPHITGIMMKNGKIIQYIDIKPLPASINVMPLVKDADISETN